MSGRTRSGDRPPSGTSPPIRGRRKLALIRDIALGEWDAPSLARMYGLSPYAIVLFCQQHDEEIAEVSAALAGTLDITTAGMWVSRRQHRLAEYQQAIDDINDCLDEYREQGIAWSRAHRDMYRARLDLYRQVADELGAYPQRTAAPSRQGQGVHYVIDSEEESDMT